MSEKSKGGAPTQYKDEYSEQAYKYCLLGADDKRLAEFFDVCEKTINNWKKQFPMFLQSIKNGKHIANANVANSLYNRATGYDYIETKKVSKDSVQGVINETHETEKHVPPDTGAAMAWLKNRDPEKWREKQEVVSTNLNVPVNEKLDSDKVTKAVNNLLDKL